MLKAPMHKQDRLRADVILEVNRCSRVRPKNGKQGLHRAVLSRQDRRRCA